MCGIVGGLVRNTSFFKDYDFHVALSSLAHRGPNDSGLERFSCNRDSVFLGQTRLSIIDLSFAGHQPMHSGCGRYSIVFNGEIYNYKELREELRSLGYKFLSDTDTEILLYCWAAWGAVCLSRLRGMFSFVIFDKVECKLFCIRDAFGIKPFFYKLDGDNFLFASELPAIRALLPSSPNLNLQRAYDYLVTGRYDNRSDTFFHGVYHLLPGHLMVINVGEPIQPLQQRWWWPSIMENNEISFEDAAEQCRVMFLRNVRQHLRSDVPLGAALSGGVDSSAIVCAIRHLEPDMPIHTFTYVARDSNIDEEMWADRVISYTKAIPHKIFVQPENLVDDIDDMIRSQGEPFCSTSIYAQYRVFKLARDCGITVTLDGQGADELLAGYQGYPGPTMHSLIESGDFRYLIKFFKNWSNIPGHSKALGIQSLIAEFVPDNLRGVALSLIGRDPAPSWLDLSYLEDNGVVPVWRSAYQKSSESTRRRLVSALRENLTGNGLNALLRHADRNSMRWSIESRVPFLTTDFAEYVLSLPEHYLISRNGQTKHIFRAAMKGIVPEDIMFRKDKIGFATPEREWLRHVGEKVYSWLEPAGELPFLKEKKCIDEVRAMINGKTQFNFRAWRLINYCRWYELLGS